jgi:hypothetical protein
MSSLSGSSSGSQSDGEGEEEKIAVAGKSGMETAIAASPAESSSSSSSPAPNNLQVTVGLSALSLNDNGVYRRQLSAYDQPDEEEDEDEDEEAVEFERRRAVKAIPVLNPKEAHIACCWESAMADASCSSKTAAASVQISAVSSAWSSTAATTAISISPLLGTAGLEHPAVKASLTPNLNGSPPRSPPMEMLRHQMLRSSAHQQPPSLVDSVGVGGNYEDDLD